MNPYEENYSYFCTEVNGTLFHGAGENANRHVVIGPDPSLRDIQETTIQATTEAGRQTPIQ